MHRPCQSILRIDQIPIDRDRTQTECLSRAFHLAPVDDLKFRRCLGPVREIRVCVNPRGTTINLSLLTEISERHLTRHLAALITSSRVVPPSVPELLHTAKVHTTSKYPGGLITGSRSPSPGQHPRLVHKSPHRCQSYALSLWKCHNHRDNPLHKHMPACGPTSG